MFPLVESSSTQSQSRLRSHCSCFYLCLCLCLSCPCCWVRHCPCLFPCTSNLWPCGQHVGTRSNSFLSISFALPLALVAFAFLRQGIDLHVVWSSPVVRCHCHACLILCVVLQELKSHCCHRFEGIQIQHTDEGALSRKRAFFIDTLKRSPEIDSHLRMFSCHSSSAISSGL